MISRFFNSVRNTFIGSPRVGVYSKADRVELILRCPWLFPNIHNPDYMDKKNAITRLPSNIAFVKYPNLELLLAAVHNGNNLSALRLMNNYISQSVLKEVVKLYPNSLQYIPYQTVELVKTALVMDFENYKYLDSFQFNEVELNALYSFYKDQIELERTRPVSQVFDWTNRLAM